MVGLSVIENPQAKYVRKVTKKKSGNSGPASASIQVLIQPSPDKVAEKRDDELLKILDKELADIFAHNLENVHRYYASRVWPVTVGVICVLITIFLNWQTDFLATTFHGALDKRETFALLMVPGTLIGIAIYYARPLLAISALKRVNEKLSNALHLKLIKTAPWHLPGTRGIYGHRTVVAPSASITGEQFKLYTGRIRRFRRRGFDHSFPEFPCVALEVRPSAIIQSKVILAPRKARRDPLYELALGRTELPNDTFFQHFDASQGDVDVLTTQTPPSVKSLLTQLSTDFPDLALVFDQDAIFVVWRDEISFDFVDDLGTPKQHYGSEVGGLFNKAETLLLRLGLL